MSLPVALAVALAMAAAGAASAGTPGPAEDAGVVDGYDYYPPAAGTALVIPTVPTGVDDEFLASLTPEEIAGVARTQLLSPTYEDLAALPGFIDGGFAADADELEFDWHGDLPAEALRVIDLATQRGLGVRVYRHDYSGAELGQALSRASAAVWDADVPVQDISIDARTGNITIRVPRGSDSASARGRAMRAAHSAAPGHSATVVPMEADEVTAVGTFDSRTNDTGEYDVAGAVRQGSGICTTGFALTRQIATGTQHYLLTAAHCSGFNNYKYFYTSAGNRYMGQNSWTSALYGSDVPNNLAARNRGELLLDATLIKLAFPTTTSTLMFQGDWAATAHYAVQGTEWIPLNTPVCVSGAATGSRCNIVRTETYMREVAVFESPPESGLFIGFADVVPVDSTNGSFMFGNGDSGAPIFYINPSGRRVITGIVEGGDTRLWQVCGSFNHYDNPSLPDDDRPHCSAYQGYVTPMSKILEELAAAGGDFSLRTQ